MGISLILFVLKDNTLVFIIIANLQIILKNNKFFLFLFY